MAFGIIINLAGTYITSLFVAKGKMKQLILYGLISALAQVIAVIALVPGFGAVGAIIAIFIIGGIFDSYLFLRGVGKVLKIRTEYKKLAMAFASNIVLSALFAIGLVLPGSILQLLYGVIVLLLAYPPLLVCFRAMNAKDVDSIKGAVEKLPFLSASLGPMLGYFKVLIGHLQ